MGGKGSTGWSDEILDGDSASWETGLGTSFGTSFGNSSSNDEDNSSVDFERDEVSVVPRPNSLGVSVEEEPW